MSQKKGKGAPEARICSRKADMKFIPQQYTRKKVRETPHVESLFGKFRG